MQGQTLALSYIYLDWPAYIKIFNYNIDKYVRVYLLGVVKIERKVQ